MYHVCIQVYSFHRKGQVVVASFMSASHRLEALGKRGPQLRRCPHPTRLWAVPALGWRSWVLQESRLSKPISRAPLLQLPSPGSCTDVSREWSVTRELRVEVSHFLNSLWSPHLSQRQNLTKQDDFKESVLETKLKSLGLWQAPFPA